MLSTGRTKERFPFHVCAFYFIFFRWLGARYGQKRWRNVRRVTTAAADYTHVEMKYEPRGDIQWKIAAVNFGRILIFAFCFVFVSCNINNNWCSTWANAKCLMNVTQPVCGWLFAMPGTHYMCGWMVAVSNIRSAAATEKKGRANNIKDGKRAFRIVKLVHV